MADFLGLGVTFSAVDKGLDQALRKSIEGFSKTEQALKGVEDAAKGDGGKGGVFEDVVEGFKLLSLGRIGSALDDISTSLMGNKDIATEFYKVLEKTNAKIGASFDPTNAQKFQKAINSSIGAMDAGEVNALATGFLKFGRSADEAAAVLPMMGKMVGTLGMDAGNVAKMFGQGLASLRATPEQMQSLMKQTVKMQKAYNLTDQLDNLPEIFEVVTKNAARFGNVQAGVAMKTVMSVSRLSASFQKMGKSQDQALGAATSFTDKLGQMQQSILDMQVGLEPSDESIFDLQQALALTGVTGQKALDMITKGFQDPEAFMKDMQGQLAGMDEDSKLAVTQRLRRIFGDDVTNMIGAYSGDVKKAVKGAEKQESGLGTASTEFDKYTRALSGTLEVQEKFTKNAEEFFKAAMITKSRGVINKYLSDQREGWGILGKLINDDKSILGQFILKLDQFKKMGMAALGITGKESAALGIGAGMLASFIFPIVTLMGLFKIFKGPLKWMFDGLKFVGEYALIAGQKIGKFLLPFLRILGLRLTLVLGSLEHFIMKMGGMLKTLIPRMLAALQSLWAVMMANPIFLIIAAIVALGAAIYFTIKYWDDVKAYMIKIFDMLPGPVQDFLIFYKNMWVASFNFVKDIVMGFVDWFSGAIDAFKAGGWSGLGTYISTTFNNAIDAVKEIFTAGLKWIEDKVDSVMNGLVGIIQKYIDIFSKKGFSGLMDDMISDAGKGLDALEEMFFGIFKNIGKIIDDNLAGFVDGMKKVAGFLTFGLLGGDDEKAVPPGLTKPAPNLVPPGLTKPAPNLVPPAVAKTSTPPPPRLKPVPVADQPGSPSRQKSTGDVEFEQRGESSDKNTQALINEIFDMKKAMVELLSLLIDRPMKVEIKGDLKKLMAAQTKQTADDLGAAGMNHAVNR